MSNPSSANLSPIYRHYLDSVAAEARNLLRADRSLDRSTAIESAFGLLSFPSVLKHQERGYDADMAYVKRQVTVR